MTTTGSNPNNQTGCAPCHHHPQHFPPNYPPFWFYPPPPIPTAPPPAQLVAGAELGNPLNNVVNAIMMTMLANLSMTMEKREDNRARQRPPWRHEARREETRGGNLTKPMYNTGNASCKEMGSSNEYTPANATPLDLSQPRSNMQTRKRTHQDENQADHLGLLTQAKQPKSVHNTHLEIMAMPLSIANGWSGSDR